jgi:hypothetical protein
LRRVEPMALSRSKKSHLIVDQFSIPLLAAINTMRLSRIVISSEFTGAASNSLVATLTQ